MEFDRIPYHYEWHIGLEFRPPIFFLVYLVNRKTTVNQQ